LADDGAGESAVITRGSTRKTALLLFFGLSILYLSLHSGELSGRGYAVEEAESGLRMMAVFNAWVKGRPIPLMIWSRHGPLPVILDLPFFKLGKLFATPDFVVSFQPILLTAGLATIAFLWLRKLASPGVSLALTLVGAFGTMWWPYAYIGLETKQSFFLFLSGYLALARGKILRPAALACFSVSCGLAMSVKSVGVILLPAIAYLVWVQFRDDWRQRSRPLLGVVAGIAVIYILSAVGRNFYWEPVGGGAANLQNWMIESPLQIPSNILGLFASPNKGLFLFAPILVLSLWAVPQTLRSNRDLAMFALLTTAGTVAFLSLLSPPYDETWGPRFMHGTIGPLLLCVGAAWPRFNWRTATATFVLGVFGVAVSFLGSFFYYGMRRWAAESSAQNTIEWLTGDSAWNEIVIDALFFRVWLRGSSEPVLFTAQHIWAWSAPPDAPRWKEIDLRQFAQPQSMLFYYLDRPKDTKLEVLLRFYIACIPVGLLLLSGAVWSGLPNPAALTAGERLKLQGRTRLIVGGAGLAVLAGLVFWVSTPERVRPRLHLSQSEVRAGKDSYALSIPELSGDRVVVRYAIDGGEVKEMEVLLDGEGSVKFQVGPETVKGVYTFINFKPVDSRFWFNSGAVLTVK
jgi:hypothetical protein